MTRVNSNFTKLTPAYLFTDIARKVQQFSAAHPGAEIIRMGIGDVTRPLCPAAIKAMHAAVDEMADPRTFHGYGPEQGYSFLREAIAATDYQDRGIGIEPDEIFVSDGAKSDLGNIGDIFSSECRVAVTDPVYPVYVDTNIMAGRQIVEYLPCTVANGFVPALPERNPDIIYLCYPNNPTGTTLSFTELKKWVDYAIAHQSVILFDSAYEAYISSPDVPHSIYEIPGARQCAIEFRSFSKTAGFTGVRCGYTVVPRSLQAIAADSTSHSLRDLWQRRQSTKFNGASYVSQRAAEAVFTPEGHRQIKETIAYYMSNAALLRRGLTEAGLRVYGGIDAPYVWAATPDGVSSWDFFDTLLERYNIVTTPGVGFGPAGEGFIRLTAFSTREATRAAVDRLLSAPVISK